MKRCKFCEHQGFTEKAEEVCTKHLMYLGDIEHDFECKEFSTDLKASPVAMAAIALISFLVLMMCLIC